MKTNFTLPYREYEDENHTALIIGDSHTDECASNVKENVNKNFNVSGYVKLGSNILTLTTSVKSAIRNLTKTYVTVFWGGNNDNGKDYSYSDNNKKENTVIDQNNEPVRMSKRNRNLPIINTVDFLWQMNTRGSNI